MNLIKVCVITSSRAEYGLIRWLMDDLKSSDDFELKVIATGSHFSEKYGLTFQEIESNGFTIDKKIPFNLENSDQTSVAKATGLLTVDLIDALDILKPDIVMIMGDRYELLSVLTACILKTIPIAHISGGEITEGAIDDQIRHALTKASHLHYVANEVYGARIVQMGEEQWRGTVVVQGAGHASTLGNRVDLTRAIREAFSSEFTPELREVDLVSRAENPGDEGSGWDRGMLDRTFPSLDPACGLQA